MRTDSIVVYQKLTVIFSDLIYYYSVYKLCRTIESSPSAKRFANQSKNETNLTPCDQNLINAFFNPDIGSVATLLLLLQPCLILIDHIHFQYNGFLSGFLLLSIDSIVRDKYALASLWFTILINLKHIYLYCAPAFGMYVLCAHCLAKPSKGGSTVLNRLSWLLKRTLKLGLVVMSVTIVAFLPFATSVASFKQVINRLFPFKRGLTHAYWAPNIWALYNLLDKVLAHFFNPPPYVKFDLESISGGNRINSQPSSTSGLVQEYKHQYLPSISPTTTFALAGLFTIPLIVKLVFNVGKKSPRLFLECLTSISFTSYIFGWHVHEKAILLVLLPLTLASLLNRNLADTFLRLTLAGIYSNFPLLYQPAEYLTKVCILVSYYHFCSKSLSSKGSRKLQQQEKSALRSLGRQLYRLLDWVFLWSIIVNEIYSSFIHGKVDYKWNPMRKLNKYEFLPLMTTSCLSALGIAFSYLEIYYDFVLASVADEVPAT